MEVPGGGQTTRNAHMSTPPRQRAGFTYMPAALEAVGLPRRERTNSCTMSNGACAPAAAYTAGEVAGGWGMRHNTRQHGRAVQHHSPVAITASKVLTVRR